MGLVRCGNLIPPRRVHDDMQSMPQAAQGDVPVRDPRDKSERTTGPVGVYERPTGAAAALHSRKWLYVAAAIVLAILLFVVLALLRS